MLFVMFLVIGMTCRKMVRTCQDNRSASNFGGFKGQTFGEPANQRVQRWRRRRGAGWQTVWFVWLYTDSGASFPSWLWWRVFLHPKKPGFRSWVFSCWCRWWWNRLPTIHQRLVFGHDPNKHSLPRGSVVLALPLHRCFIPAPWQMEMLGRYLHSLQAIHQLPWCLGWHLRVKNLVETNWLAQSSWCLELFSFHGEGFWWVAYHVCRHDGQAIIPFDWKRTSKYVLFTSIDDDCAVAVRYREIVRRWLSPSI